MSYEARLDVAVTSYYKDYLNYLKRLKQEINNKMDSEVLTAVEQIFFRIFYDQMIQHPKSYWDVEVAKNTYNELTRLDNSGNLYLNSHILQYYIYAKDNYDYVTDIINDLSYINESEEMKNKMYRLPTYVNIAESVMSNLFRFTVLLIDQNSELDYTKQKALRPLLDVLNSNNFGFLSEHLDVDIRNAINHGSVSFSNQRISHDEEYEITKGDYIIFRYRSGPELQEKVLDAYEFERLIEYNYDVAGGFLMGITLFLNNNFNRLAANMEMNEYILNELLRMRISVPGINCKSIFKTKNIKDEIQLNVELEFEDGDKGTIGKTVYNVSFLVHSIYNKSDVDVYFFGINHLRSNKGWIKLYKSDIEDVLYGEQKIVTICQRNINEGRQLIWTPSDEKVNLREIKYFKFPNYISNELKILNIRDSSIESIKRLTGEAYIGQDYDREKVIEKIEDIINWMKDLKNPPCPANRVKHGNMEADVLYINIYESDRRRSRKDLFSSNDNFVCRVEYTKDRSYRIEHSGLPEIAYKKLYSEDLELDRKSKARCLILWKEKKYRTIRKTDKIGRNELCPCGSEKKYKKCCLNKST